MSIWNRVASFVSRPAVADWLIRRAMKTPYTHLPRTDDPSYMARYWVFNPYDRKTNKPRWFFCPWSIRIHHIKREDFDRDVHDHPWNARTVILKGHYIEDRLVPADAIDLIDIKRPITYVGDEPFVTNVYWRQEGDTAKLGFGEYHSITEVSDGGVWTLFISGPWRGVWGFLVDGVKIPWKTYLGVPEKGDLDDPKPAVQEIFCGLPSDEKPQLLQRGERVLPNFAKGGLVGQHGEVPQIISTERCISLAHARRLGLVSKAAINREYGSTSVSVSVPFPFFSEHELKVSREQINGQLAELKRLDDPIIGCKKERSDKMVTDLLNLTEPGATHHPLRNIVEWRTGCSCATPGNPVECTECTLGLIDAIERWHQQNDCVHGRLIETLAKSDVDASYSEDEFFVAEAAHQHGFETVNDDASVYACTLGQLVALMRTYGVTTIKGRE